MGGDKLLERLYIYLMLQYVIKKVLACIEFNVTFLVGLAEKCCRELARILLPRDVRSLQFSLCPNPTSVCSLEYTKENIREAWLETYR
jgi:hypothetical protein